MNTRIKFCGIRREQDASLAADCGADAIGVVFTARSRRCVDIDQAVRIRQALSPLVSLVALFMDDSPERIREVIDAVQPDLLQFHGSEPAATCESWGRRYLKAIGMASVDDLDAALREHPRASGFVLDGHARGEPGGRGRSFEWRPLPAAPPCLLAGGLTPDNVADAIRIARPWGVDVSSGVEDASGYKDPERMQAFAKAVRNAG